MLLLDFITIKVLFLQYKIFLDNLRYIFYYNLVIWSINILPFLFIVGFFWIKVFILWLYSWSSTHICITFYYICIVHSISQTNHQLKTTIYIVFIYGIAASNMAIYIYGLEIYYKLYNTNNETASQLPH